MVSVRKKTTGWRRRRGVKEKFCFVELFGKMCGT
jgi:hypothetical protein